MRQFFIILLILLCGAALLSFVALILSSPESRVVLARFDPPLSEPIPEAPYVAPRTLEQGDYILKNGTVTFSLEHPIEALVSHTGTVTFTNGRLTLDESHFGNWSGDSVFIIDMNDITFTDDDHLHQLTGNDFFAIKEHRYATLTINSISRQGNSSLFTLAGRLSLRGQTHDVILPDATLYIKNDTLVLDADFTFDRTQWGMTRASPSFSGTLGSETIADKVNVNLVAEFLPPVK